MITECWIDKRRFAVFLTRAITKGAETGLNILTNTTATRQRARGGQEETKRQGFAHCYHPTGRGGGALETVKWSIGFSLVPLKGYLAHKEMQPPWTLP